MRRTEKYAAVTKEEAERSPSALLRAMSLSNGRWTFYKAVKIQNGKEEPLSLKSCCGHREVPE
jgi:hypothetical protein